MLFLTVLTVTGFGQTLPVVVLDLELDNAVTYRHDTADPLAQAKQTGPTTSPAPTNFFWTNSIQDLRLINGRAARGTAVFQTYRISTSPNPAPGGAIADITRGTGIQLTIEIQQENGTAIGSLMMVGLGGGAPPPGSSVNGLPPGTGLAFNLAIVGGTGAYIGARGQMVSLPSMLLPAVQAPTRSSTEDPSQRRNLGGGSSAFRLYLIPAVVPTVQSAMHADFSPVSPANPARRGEVILLRVTGLGPTDPASEYGAAYLANPLARVNSPVEVRIAGKDLPTVNQVGWPGTMDSYRVDFRVPDDTAAGEVGLRVVAAFVPSREFTIPVGN